MNIARRLEKEARITCRELEPCAKNGVPGSIGIETLELLYKIVDFATGRLERSVKTIVDNIGRSLQGQ